MDEVREKRKFRLKTIFFMIGCVFKSSPVLFPLMIVLSMVSIGLTAYALFILRDTTNAIVDLLNLKTTYDKVLLLVLFYLIIEIVITQILQIIIDYSERHYYKQADRYFRILLLYKLGKLPQINMYDSNMYNKYEFTYTYLYMFQQLPWHLISFMIQFSFSKLLYLGIIYSFNPVAGFYCTILFLFNILVSIFITGKKAKTDKELVLPNREKGYYNSLITEKSTIKETKINRLETYFFKKYSDLYYKIRDSYFRINNSETWLNQVIQIFNFLFNHGLMFLLLYMVFHKWVNIGEMILIQTAGSSLIFAATQFRRPTQYIVQFAQYAPTMIEMLYPLTKQERKEIKEKEYQKFDLKLGEFQSLALDNISFQYPNKESEAVSGVNLKIQKVNIINAASPEMLIHLRTCYLF
jgi:ABC-type bacteriocin/lantibiotic exporter with double-glycine peptidase domain